MIDTNEIERAALKAAGQRAGEFLDRIETTDMAKWSETQFVSLIEVICGAYVDSLLATENNAKAAANRVKTGVPF